MQSIAGPTGTEFGADQLPFWLTGAQAVTWVASRDVEWTFRVVPRHEKAKARVWPASDTEEIERFERRMSDSARATLTGGPECWDSLMFWLGTRSGGERPADPLDQVVDACRAGLIATKIKDGPLLVAEDWIGQKLVEARSFVFVMEPGLSGRDSEQHPVSAAEEGLAATAPTVQLAIPAVDQDVLDWAAKVCTTLNDAGKRISKEPFKGVAWEHFRNRKGLTDKDLGEAWTFGRRSVGWPDSGTISSRLRISEEELRQTLRAADLMSATKAMSTFQKSKCN